MMEKVISRYSTNQDCLIFLRPLDFNKVKEVDKIDTLVGDLGNPMNASTTSKYLLKNRPSLMTLASRIPTQGKIIVD